VESAKLDEIAIDREVFQVLLWMLSLPTGKSGMKMKEMNNIYVNLFTGV